MQPRMAYSATHGSVTRAIFELDRASAGPVAATPREALAALLSGSGLNLRLDQFLQTLIEPARSRFELREADAVRFVTETIRIRPRLGWVATGFVACNTTLVTAKR